MACAESSENFYISRCFGCLMVYTLGYFIRWQRIARFAILVPIAAGIVAIFTASESPVYLVSQNKVIFAHNISFKPLYRNSFSMISILLPSNQNISNHTDRTGKKGPDTSLWPEVQSPRGS